MAQPNQLKGDRHDIATNMEVLVMANYKRGKCRRNSIHALRGSEASRRARLGFKPVRLDGELGRYSMEIDAWRVIWPRWYKWTAHGPAWHDRTFHSRPKRLAARRVAKDILRGVVDPDEAVWPLSSNRPTKYYW